MVCSQPTLVLRDEKPGEDTELEHITISELVKKLIVPPGKRTDKDCRLMAHALFFFIASIPGFKDGLLISFASL